MELKDLFLTPLYLLFFYVAGTFIRAKYFSEGPMSQYFMPALLFKALCVLFIDIIYLFYYKGGDTINYYNGAKIITEAFADAPLIGIKMWLTQAGDYRDPEVNQYLFRYWMFRDPSSFLVIKIASFFSMLSFNSYIVISLFFAFISFSGNLVLYKLLYNINPKLEREFAIISLFIPSVILWGSGLFKDTITFTGLCWLTYGCYAIFIRKIFRIKYVLYLVLSTALITSIKTYIILTFAPPVAFWVFLHYKAKISSRALNYIVTPFVLLIAGGCGFLLIQSLGSFSAEYSLETISKKAYDTQWWHSTVLELYGDDGGGSYYSLGKPDASFSGMMLKVLPAINVTLFRPYIWEVNSIVMLMAGLESLFITIFTLRIFVRSGFMRSLTIIIEDPFIVFCLSFALIFAFGVGLTSYNFGALVRYKIPCIPFYLAALVLIRDYADQKRGKYENALG